MLQHTFLIVQETKLNAHANEEGAERIQLRLNQANFYCL